eukprot:jgi/Chlat1/65/Chrsp1S03115
MATATGHRVFRNGGNGAVNGAGEGDSLLQQRRRVRGVVFDMDGTLTVPCIDFELMRKRVGILTGDILTVIDSWGDPERQKLAYAAITEVETEANERLQIMPGALELCRYLDDKGIRRGLITRNVDASVRFFHSHFQAPPFNPALSREFRPYKPHAAPLMNICEQWGFSTHEVMMIGDSAKDDVVCGRRAGAITCLIDTEDRYGDGSMLEGEEVPDFMVKALTDVEVLFDKHLVLEPGTKVLS